MQTTDHRHQPSPLLVIVGETGSGKSALAIELAESCGGELICADSWTVYRGFDIGTAKPPREARARVAHHLLDIADPQNGFSAVEFQSRALAAIKDIDTRGKLPIMVGGTGLYVDSIIFHYSFLPAPSPDRRLELNALSLEELQGLVRDQGIDPMGIDLRNKRRIIRLLESGGVRPVKHSLRKNTLIIGIKTDKERLSEQVSHRVDAMLGAGLEQEVRKLAEHYDWSVEPMKGIGYREWEAYFAGTQTLEQTRGRIVSATMNLAKRQRTWFKRNDSIHWLTSEDKVIEAVEYATTYLNT